MKRQPGGSELRLPRPVMMERTIRSSERGRCRRRPGCRQTRSRRSSRGELRMESELGCLQGGPDQLMRQRRAAGSDRGSRLPGRHDGVAEFPPLHAPVPAPPARPSVRPSARARAPPLGARSLFYFAAGRADFQTHHPPFPLLPHLSLSPTPSTPTFACLTSTLSLTSSVRLALYSKNSARPTAALPHS